MRDPLFLRPGRSAGPPDRGARRSESTTDSLRSATAGLFRGSGV